MKTVLLYYSNSTKPTALLRPVLERFKSRAMANYWPLVAVTDKHVVGVTHWISFDSCDKPMEQSIFGKLVSGLEWIQSTFGENVRVFLCDDDVIHPDEHYYHCPDNGLLCYNLNFVYVSQIGTFTTCHQGSLTNGGLSGPVDKLLSACRTKLAAFDGIWEPSGGVAYRSTAPCIDLRGPWNNTWQAWIGNDGQVEASNQPAMWTNETNQLIEWAKSVVAKV